MRALVRQIFDYSKGHVAYHLTTYLRDGDPRAIPRLLIELPLAHLWRIHARIRRRSAYTVLLVVVEVAGHLAGPWALWRARRQVTRLGHRPRCAPPRARPVTAASDKALAGTKVAAASVLDAAWAK
jgi:hypothetical protein